MSGNHRSTGEALSLPPVVLRDLGKSNARQLIAGECPKWLAALIAGAPFNGQATLRRLSVHAVGEYAFAVAVPVRNEREILPRMLAALLRAMNNVRERGLAVFAVNDTYDGSGQLIWDWLRLNGLSGVIIEVGVAPAIRSAPYTRRLALDVASRFAPAGALLTTDADSEVGQVGS